ncbi:MAG TPA: riboflavin synthase [Phycisphaerae bacterium]|nr:riboflavin synthase [Phycisphaerae bacterium]HNU43951.1 riboflavin synthase [Phycisphaerae bacterium]
MFTGIVEATGTVVDTRAVTGGRRLRVRAETVATDASEGASICVSGVCLTVAEVRPPILDFDVIQETLGRSTLGEKRVGDAVNLERSLCVGDRLDGHFVQGHVDGTAQVTRVQGEEREWRLWLAGGPELEPYLVPKGSITVDGVSLTLVEVRAGEFCVALIPTTLQRTTLAALAPRQRVNVETDVLIRAVVHWLTARPAGSGLTLAALREAGFA